MPDGCVQNGDYETKDLAHLGYRMRFCVVTEDGRLVCGEDGDLRYNGSVAINDAEHAYVLDFESGKLSRIGCFDADGALERHEFDASNYRAGGATKAHENKD
jgi:hypothetical protein